MSPEDALQACQAPLSASFARLTSSYPWPAAVSMARAGRPSARRPVRCAASGGGSGGPPERQQQAPPPPASTDESDAMFLLKLAAISVTLGAAIKYGSLLTDLAFTVSTG